MSTRELGTIQATKTRIDRTAAWIFALLLAVLLAVSLIATTGPGRVVDRAPAGGPTTANRDAPPNDATAWQPIVVNGADCHQCR